MTAIPPTYSEPDAPGSTAVYWIAEQGRMPFGTGMLFTVRARANGKAVTLAGQCEIHHAIHIVNALRAYPVHV